jgi:hypothetical protein
VTVNEYCDSTAVLTPEGALAEIMRLTPPTRDPMLKPRPPLLNAGAPVINPLRICAGISYI